MSNSWHSILRLSDLAIELLVLVYCMYSVAVGVRGWREEREGTSQPRNLATGDAERFGIG